MKAEAEFGVLIFPIAKRDIRRPERKRRILRVRAKDLVEMFVMKDRKALKKKYRLSDEDVREMIIRLRKGRWKVA
jgi:hypothetical protein